MATAPSNEKAHAEPEPAPSPNDKHGQGHGHNKHGHGSHGHGGHHGHGHHGHGHGHGHRHGQDHSEEMAHLPEELQFLRSPECNPNLKDPKIRKIGFMRQAKHILSASSAASTRQITGHSRMCALLRNVTGCIVRAAPVQFVMMIVIVMDCTVAIMSIVSDVFENPDEETETFLRVLDYLVVFLLSFDVLGRFFVEGFPFLRSKLNLLELLLVPITIVEVFFLKDLNAPVPLIRALRPILRGIRIFRILVRTAGKGANYLAYMRRQVSGERVRFMQDGFDLDLAYISGQIICMSLPGAGYERLLHNPYPDVACFLNERHGNKYLLVNVTQERRYPLKPFFGRYYQYGIPYQGVPQLQELMKVCERIDYFLKADPEHVVAIHSYHGQGRVSMMVIALLLYRGTCPTVTSSISHVEHNRTNKTEDGEAATQTLDNASQRRFMEYFGQMCRMQSGNAGESTVQVQRPARLRKISLHGVSNNNRLDVKCFVPSCEGAGGGDEAGDPTRSLSMSRESEKEKEDKEKALGLVERVTKIINESSLDSIQAGCQPMTGRPVWETSRGSAEPSVKRSNSKLSSLSSFLEPARWESNESSTRFSGEFRLEFHRVAVQDGRTPKPSNSQNFSGGGMRCLRCCCCKRKKDSRNETQNKLAQAYNGMLFGCWLHSDFLELDEPTDNPTSKKQLVMVELDRFNMDKASNAPTLRSYSSVLKLQLEFEVERRIEWTAPEEEEELAEHMQSLPPTANMSESYTLDWLTWVSKRVWPLFTTSFENLIRNNVMPSLKESMPGPLKNIRLAQCSFGTAYPQFGPISACSRNVDGLEVQLDIQLNYSTATNIVLDAGLVSFGISHLKLSGVLSLRFKPILSELPVFSAMQLLFLNLPEVDLRFARTLEIANSARVRSLIFGAINKGLCDLMVLPNIININWADPNDDALTALNFRNVRPCAVLRLRVIEARDLFIESRLFKTAPDTFIKVQLGAQVTQTPTIAKNSSPVWGVEFDFLVYDEQQHITATAMDVDYSGRTHSIGSVNRLPVLSLVGAGSDGKWLPLTSSGGGSSKARGGGDILLSGQMLELVPDRDELEGLCPAACGSPVSQNRSRASGRNTQGTANAVEGDLEAQEEEDDGEDGLDMEDQDQDDGPTEFRSGSAALLICEIFGGSCPSELAAASTLDIMVTLGKAEDKQRCVEAQSVDPGSVSEKSMQRIERLAGLGLDAAAIADSLGEDIADVQRIMRKCGWNLELPQKICILASESDLSTAEKFDISVCLKKKVLASVHIPLSRILEAPSCKRTEVITCRSDRHRHKVELDAEFRLFYLKPRVTDN